ncbi:hypothetical protein [Plantactinospora soyae]|uniref:Uncharacterized protein n=1 Tax=Plantactinospora soyae TaxID=1544732 RepID=A0A927QZD7_9ACTN|nr:hypothetical protein [Plantactinospora soyae]MBE1488927.1 hypothetical protein [Plantactinospora soyae]
MVYPSGPGPLDFLSQRYTQLRLLGQNGVAELYGGVDHAGTPVSVVVLTGPAAADQQLRGAFGAAVGNSSYAPYAGDLLVHAADLSGPRPWAATHQLPGQPGAERLLTGLPGGPITAAPPGAPFTATPPGMPPTATLPGAPLPPAPPGAVPGWPPPPGYPAGPPPPAGMSTGLKTTLIAGGVVLLLVVGLGVFAVAKFLPDSNPVARSTAGPSTQDTPDPSAVPEPSGSDPSGTSTPRPGEPTLRTATPVTVLGPSYADGDKTYTMAFSGWPIAFRTPETWGCMGGRPKIPDSKSWVCIDEGNPGSRQRAHVLLRPCATTCTAAEQKAMNEAWLDEPEKAKVVRQRTYYVETSSNDKGLYAVDASHFFKDPQDGTRHWQIGVYVESPPDTRNQVLKILNDVVSQAG